ncbi:MAG: sulfite exporter TauE/SafE family protein [Methanobacteriota archaeon]|nr:MAG: sulfite exporter TauE/SafE family protein [Euryarchaeota archaeon]
MVEPHGTLAERPAGLLVGALLAAPIGVLSGFAGVGGGEYRAPILLVLLGRVRWAIATNLLIGLIVATFTVLFRQAWNLPPEALVLGLLLIPGGFPGAYLGAVVTRRISSRALKALLAGILVVTGLRLMLFEIPGARAVSLDALTVSLALLLGFGLGVISGLLGVAAGEYRIPALIFLFGISPVFAGTLSSLASIPSQLMGYMTHRSLGHASRRSTRLGAVMGIASVAGVLVGVLLLSRTTEALVSQVLGFAMVLAAARIVWDIRHPHPAEAASSAEQA